MLIDRQRLEMIIDIFLMSTIVLCDFTKMDYGEDII